MTITHESTDPEWAINMFKGHAKQLELLSSTAQDLILGELDGSLEQQLDDCACVCRGISSVATRLEEYLAVIRANRRIAEGRAKAPAPATSAGEELEAAA